MDSLQAAPCPVGWCGSRITSAESEAGLGLPVVGEAPNLVEVMGRQSLAPVGEHAASTDGGKLRRVAHADQSPAVTLDHFDEGVKVVGRMPFRPRRGPLSSRPEATTPATAHPPGHARGAAWPAWWPASPSRRPGRQPPCPTAPARWLVGLVREGPLRHARGRWSCPHRPGRPRAPIALTRSPPRPPRSGCRRRPVAQAPRSPPQNGPTPTGAPPDQARRRW